MSKQLHKNFTDGQVKLLFEKYSKGEIKLNYILQMLRIKRSRFFELLNRYKKIHIIFLSGILEEQLIER